MKTAKHTLFSYAPAFVLGIAIATGAADVNAGPVKKEHHIRIARAPRHHHFLHHHHMVEPAQAILNWEGPPLPPDAILSQPLPDVVIPQVGGEGHGER